MFDTGHPTSSIRSTQLSRQTAGRLLHIFLLVEGCAFRSFQNVRMPEGPLPQSTATFCHKQHCGTRGPEDLTWSQRRHISIPLGLKDDLRRTRVVWHPSQLYHPCWRRSTGVGAIFRTVCRIQAFPRCGFVWQEFEFEFAFAFAFAFEWLGYKSGEFLD